MVPKKYQSLGRGKYPQCMLSSIFRTLHKIEMYRTLAHFMTRGLLHTGTSFISLKVLSHIYQINANTHLLYICLPNGNKYINFYSEKNNLRKILHVCRSASTGKIPS
jgi:hypothetical protein